MDTSFVGGLPAPGCSLAEILAWRGRHQPERLAYAFLSDGETADQRLTYGEVDAAARTIAAGLRCRQATGQRAILAHPPGLEFIEAFFGCLYAGVHPIPAYPPHRSDRMSAALQQLGAIADDASPSFVLTTKRTRQKLAPLLASVPALKKLEWIVPSTSATLPEEGEDPLVASRTDLAYLQYTSGSTARPKGVMVSHGALMEQLELYRMRAGSRWHDNVMVGWLPHQHDYGLVGFVLSSAFMGVPYYFMRPSAFIRKPSRWLEAISRFSGTYSGAPPFAYELCVDRISSSQKSNLDLNSWRIASIAAEPVAPKTLETFAAAFAPVGFDADTFMPCYGLAEAVLCVSSRMGTRTITASGSSLVSVGQAMPGQTVLIVDPITREICRDGQVGEIWVRGASVASGYWGRPEETERTFGARLAGTADAPFLRTGDLAFINSDEVFIVDRLKDVIIVRGQNHHPHDIERTAQDVDRALLRGSGAAFQVETGGDQHLVLVQELQRGFDSDVDALVNSVRRAVADAHGLELHTVELIAPRSIPKTLNGKIKRGETRAAYLAADLSGVANRTSGRGDLIAANGSSSDIEGRLGAIWGAALRLPWVGAHEDFFSLGGDSLAAQRILAEVGETFGVDLPVRTLFERPTIAEIAEHLRAVAVEDAGSIVESQKRIAAMPRPAESPRAGGDVLRRLERLEDLMAQQAELLRKLAVSLPADGNEPHPVAPSSVADEGLLSVTDSQREVTLVSSLDPDGTSVFHLMGVLRIAEKPDMLAIAETLRHIGRRHDSLRTVLEPDARHTRVLTDFVVEIPLIDLSTGADDDLECWLMEERDRGFDLHRGPLWRAHVVLPPHGAALLVLTAHHLISDGWSLQVLAGEIASCYAEVLGGEECSLPPAVQFGEYSRLRERRALPELIAAHRDHWLDTVGPDLPILELLPEKPRPSAVSFAGASWTVEIGTELRTALVRAARSQRCTLSMTLLAVYSGLLHRLSGQDRILIGFSDAGRHLRGSETVVGNCQSALPFLSTVEGDPSVAHHLAATRDMVIGALDHRECTLPMLVQSMQLPVDPTRPFIIATNFNMQVAAESSLGFAPAPDLQARSVTRSPLDIEINATDDGEVIRLDFDYKTGVYDEATIARIADYYLRMAESAVRNLGTSVLEIPFVPEVEEQKLLHEWGSGGNGYAGSEAFSELFEAQVARSPHAVAVVDDEQRLSYADLNEQANRVAAYLLEEGVSTGTVVALLADRSVEFLIGLLGILKAGGVYLPPDLRDPDERIRLMLSRSSAQVILAGSGFEESAERAAAGMEAAARPRVALIRTGHSNSHAENPESQVALEQPAYIIYTSGSTGTPKGAIVTQAGMVNHLRSKISTLELTAQDVVAQTAGQNFDISVWQLLAPLLVGASVSVLADTVTHDPERLLRTLERLGVTVVELVPSMLRLVIDDAVGHRAGQPDLSNLRWMIATGEPLPPDLCRKWLSRYPRVRLLNAYGPTECSDDVTHHTIDWPPPPGTRHTPIGRPIAGAQLYVLDRRMQLTATGTPGELYVGGVCVGLGYVNEPSLTAAAFGPNPFSNEQGERLYRTGDIARYRDNGDLEYLGRIDDQYKLNGVRIEPSEIEEVLLTHPTVRECVVAIQETDDAGQFLAGFVVLQDGAETTPEELRYHLRKRLPHHMVPARVEMIQAVPVTTTGKTDRGALPVAAPTVLRKGSGIPPRTPIESVVAEIWATTLHIDEIGAEDDLFDLGGRSLDAAQIAAGIQAAYQVQVPLHEIYQKPTVAALARYVESTLAHPPISASQL